LGPFFIYTVFSLKSFINEKYFFWNLKNKKTKTKQKNTKILKSKLEKNLEFVLC